MRPFRVLIAKPGLDGHDRGAKVVARALRDAGFEVVYTGIRQTPEQIAEAALQEDVDAVGISILSGAHRVLIPRVAELVRDKMGRRVVLFAGGVIPAADVSALKSKGVGAVFGPGSRSEEIVSFLKKSLSAAAK
jgi:methylmalonyl-CoA mutase, C-terminal domain